MVALSDSDGLGMPQRAASDVHSVAQMPLSGWLEAALLSAIKDRVVPPQAGGGPGDGRRCADRLL